MFERVETIGHSGQVERLQETWRTLKINEANPTHVDYLELGSFLVYILSLIKCIFVDVEYCDIFHLAE